MATIHLNIDESVFLPCYQPYITDYSYRYNVYYGGRGSGKTIFVMDKLLISPSTMTNEELHKLKEIVDEEIKKRNGID